MTGKHFIFFLALLLPFTTVFGQVDRYAGSPLKFGENKGQWDERVRYRADLGAGYLFLEDTALTYFFRHPEDLEAIHEWHHHNVPPTEGHVTVRNHAFRVTLEGANQQPALSGQALRSDYENYYLGSDRSRWASRVRQFREVFYADVYPNIDFRIYGRGPDLKYDFLVRPGGHPEVIRLAYTGVDRLKLSGGRLHITTSMGTMVEARPYIYQDVNGQRKAVKGRFALDGHTVSFRITGKYDPALPLIIDPTLIFSTYTGSASDNWGYTASYDEAGNAYGGGIIINDPNGQYPVSLGAFQTTYGGGEGSFSTQCDISIVKYSSDGSNLEYSTYLGGSGNESPHSLVVNNNNELYVLGTTSSNNYPTTVNAYDTTFGGGPLAIVNSIQYTGSDIIVTKFDSNGTTLLGSTYMGGTDNDGLNDAVNPTQGLFMNYGDQFRGEIIVDSLGNAYVATVTASTDFPTTAQSAQPNFGGGAQDAIAFKLSPNLDNLIWSTFLGGSGADAAYGVQFDQNSDAYITGGTVSQDFPTTPNALNPSHQGGTDGFIVHLNNAGSSILAATYLGTPSYDQCYFVQLDFADNVYVVGQTQGNYPVTAGVYNNPNSGQFIHKLQPGLAATDFSLVFGSGQGDIDISPSAFLVNSCGHILVSGWGGVTNQPPNGLAANSSTLGMPTTSGGFQPNPPNGSDFYFMVLDTNAVGLLFGTFFGGGNTNEHVDGGTSRFDKKGVIYQAVCAGCGFAANPQFPTTAGSWSPSQPINPMNNLNVNCNLAVIKYDLITLEAIAQTNGPPVVCVNDTINFSNLSLGGQNFAWDFDDGATSGDFEPAHAFTAPGTYTVMLAIQDSVSCIKQDTDFVTITVLPPPVAQVGFIQPICPGDSVQLFASGGTSYSWSPAGGLNRTDIPNPTAGPSSSRTYHVTVSDSCGMDIDSVRVIVREDPTDVMNDTAICNGQFVTLQASGGISYSWTPVQFLDKPGTQFPVARPDTSVQFTVAIVDSNGCSWTQQVWVFVEEGTPDVITWGDTAICPSGEAQIHASGGFEFTWEPITGLNDPTVNHPVARPEETTVYVVEVSNACGLKRDSVVVEVRGVTLEASGDTMVCPGQPVALTAVGTGGTLYRWVPEASVQNPVALNTIANPQVPTTYIITAVNDIGCSLQDSVFVEIAPDPFLEIDAADTVLGLDPLTLVVLGNGSLTWSPDYNISCLDCPEVTVFPDVPTTYRVDLVDDNGCTNFDFIHVDVFPSIYIPNAFTPGDGNANNPLFRAYGERIIGFEMVIFDRWGRVLFESFNLEDGWDGTYRNGGGEVPSGVYAYRIKYTVRPAQQFEKLGHVTLVR